jgi:acyl-coenzyme A thioesterase PaaI-like protein
MSADTGVVRGEGKTLHVGRQMAIGEGRLLDANGRLLAHGTTTCHVVRQGVS